MDIELKELQEAFAAQGYIADEQVFITIHLALKFNKPLLVEGPAGVGKTEIAKVLSSVLNSNLLRLQCYEGLDESKALYEWNYQAQLLALQVAAKNGQTGASSAADLFSTDYLLERPLLKAIRSQQPVVLLIDEIDKTDEEFEAFLFEILSDFQVSIPELGTVRAKQAPTVVLTSNCERELSDGLRRRCVYLYIDYPSAEKETAIVQAKIPEAGWALVEDVVAAVQYLRANLTLQKAPSIAETLDWTKALLACQAAELAPKPIVSTLGFLLKHHEDTALFYRTLGPEGLCAVIHAGQNTAVESQEPKDLSFIARVKKKFQPIPRDT